MTERRAARGGSPAQRVTPLPALLLALGMALATGCDSADPPTRAAPPGPTGIRYLSSTDAETAAFALATAPRDFEFPADHASHPGFRTEWWYFTGNLRDARARHYGFELTVFRIALRPDSPTRESSLAATEIWMANLAVTDTARSRFAAAERLSRGAAGLAGAPTRAAVADGANGPILVRVEDWSIAIDGDRVALDAADEAFGIDLELTGLDHIVAQGDNGLDRKGPEPGNASFYYSAPRLAVSGSLRPAGGEPVAVTGSAWMDREWSTSALSSDVVGWDWFALQLDDGRDLMFYRLRESGGGTSDFSGGSLVDATGELTRLEAADVALEPLREWRSDATGVRYPVAWRMTIPAANLALTIEPRIDAQELDLTVRYWEGAVSVSGTGDGERIAGVGYLELAGY